jgi:hypothetical protein
MNQPTGEKVPTSCRSGSAGLLGPRPGYASEVQAFCPLQRSGLEASPKKSSLGGALYPCLIRHQVFGNLLAQLVGNRQPASGGYNQMMASSRLALVQQQLRLYEHALVEFDAREKGEAVELIIRPRFADPALHTYYFELHPRDLDDPQFEWGFQRQIFDCLHDYLVEMFIRTPQHRKEHQQMEREGKL